MAIRIEFYGIARERAQVAEIVVSSPSASMTLGQLLRHVVEVCPNLRDECITDDRMQEGFLANLDGRQFVSDPALMIKPGQAVLILSADAGG